MSSEKVLLGVVVGATMGAIAGVLFSPAKGSVTRKKIARTGKEYAEEVKEKFNEYVDTVTEDYDALKEGTLDLVRKGKERAVSLADIKHIK